MSHQVIHKSERVKLFLREYYSHQRVWVRIMRIVGGPIIIATGLRFYFDFHRSMVAYGGFCFLYGIYYTLKPLLIIIVRPTLFHKLDFILLVKESELVIQESEIESVVQFKAFASIRILANNYALKLPDKLTLYLRTDQLDKQEQDIINKHLTK